MPLVMMMALNRTHEFKMHVKAAVNNGLTREEIKETILHAAVYLGLPAANDAFAQANEVLKDIGI